MNNCIIIIGGWVILDAPDKAVIMEETMYLTCRIRGHRLPKEVIFFFNGREIMRQLPSTLIVRNLTVNQGGEYSCRATWEVRGSYHSAESTAVPVTVLGKNERIMINKSESCMGLSIRGYLAGEMFYALLCLIQVRVGSENANLITSRYVQTVFVAYTF